MGRYSNTLSIVNQNCQTQNGGLSAAEAALNYEDNEYSDWYLPSKDELLEIYNNIGPESENMNLGILKLYQLTGPRQVLMAQL